MIIISHRGNLDGPSPAENSPEQISLAIKRGFFVEVDAWRIGKECYTGHDAPTYPLVNVGKRIVWHAKNLEAAMMFEPFKQKWFSHNVDAFAVVNNWNTKKKKVLWGFPDSFNASVCGIVNAIVIIPGDNFEDYKSEIMCGLWFGVCTDYPVSLKRYLKEIL
jgi:hypothetical protein